MQLITSLVQLGVKEDVKIVRVGEERALITASINVDGVVNAKELRVDGKNVCDVCGSSTGARDESPGSAGPEEKETNAVIAEYKVLISSLKRPLCVFASETK